MSCGTPHERHEVHDTECTAALDRLYEYLDGELTPEVHVEIRAHLEECAPCLAEHDIEKAVKALLARSCQDAAPQGLRERILVRITEVRSDVEP